MSWLKELYEIYDANEASIGIDMNRDRGKSTYTLLPISHTSQTAHIEVTLDEEGKFHDAEVLDKVITLIPTTEQSSSRAGSAVFPYPLHDKLSYVAGDLINFGGEEKELKQFEAYIDQLEDWAESNYGTSAVKLIFKYLSNKTLIQDLVLRGILAIDKNNELIKKWNRDIEKEYGEKPAVYTKVPGDIVGAFVRFNIFSPTKQLKNVWQDSEQFNSFINYYDEKLGQSDFCFVTGEYGPITERHANKIRHSGDKAKLISSNDKTWFTYRGRFANSLETAAISYEVSQKAHNSLKWLISRQGLTIDGRVFLVWGNENAATEEPTPFVDSYDMFSLLELVEEKNANTLEVFSSEVRKAILGYKADLTTKANVNILVLDAATPGRMSVQYFRNMDKEMYLERLEQWHSKCSWKHNYRKNEKSDKFIIFEGAPSPKDIAFAAYGRKANDKVVKEVMERLLPSIVDGRDIPLDIIQNCVNRAKNPVAMDGWEWRKTLSIACAVLNYKEETGVALNKETTDRSYLFGRLLAVADHIEGLALSTRNDKRQTNAQRLMSAFSNMPKDTWGNIYKNLGGYWSRLYNNGSSFNQLIIEITDRFEFEEFSNKRLDNIFLQGYSSQLIELRKKKDVADTLDKEEIK